MLSRLIVGEQFIWKFQRYSQIISLACPRHISNTRAQKREFEQRSQADYVASRSGTNISILNARSRGPCCEMGLQVWFAGFGERLEKCWAEVKQRVIAWARQLMPGISGLLTCDWPEPRGRPLRQVPQVLSSSGPSLSAQEACMWPFIFFFFKATILSKGKSNAIFHSETASEFSYQVISGKYLSLNLFVLWDSNFPLLCTKNF